jgi:solute carrier family 39 (zinc transporter), member 11
LVFKYIENNIKLGDNKNNYNHVKYESNAHYDDKSIRQRNSNSKKNSDNLNEIEKIDQDKKFKFRKIVLLIIAVTVHNIPEGLAVGVGFGAVGKTKKATFQNARLTYILK